MTNNRKIANSIFKELINNDLHPIDIAFGNGYFIFEYGEDSVVHFHIKEIKNWKFGIWINTNDEKRAIQFFAQYEDFIDKFKPSTSTFVEDVTKQDLKNITIDITNAHWAYYDIVRMCNHIRYNPRLAFVQEGTYNKYVKEPLWKLYTKQKFDSYKDRLYKTKKHIIEDIFAYHFNRLSSKIAKIKYSDIIEDIRLTDGNTENWTVYPRYDVDILFKRVHEDDVEQGKEMSKLWDTKLFPKLFTTINTDIFYYVDKISRETQWY